MALSGLGWHYLFEGTSSGTAVEQISMGCIQFRSLLDLNAYVDCPECILLFNNQSRISPLLNALMVEWDIVRWGLQRALPCEDDVLGLESN